MVKVAGSTFGSSCFLAAFTDTPCAGRLIKAHLIPQQRIKREFPKGHNGVSLTALLNDSRSYVLACGGIIGNSGHHGELDYSRKIRIPLDQIPDGTKTFAQELGLLVWLEHEYGGMRHIPTRRDRI